MWISRKRFMELENEVSRLKYISNNPAKYKQGDKPDKDHIIIHVSVQKIIGYDYLCGAVDLGWEWKYTAANIKTGKKKIYQ